VHVDEHPSRFAPYVRKSQPQSVRVEDVETGRPGRGAWKDWRDRPERRSIALPASLDEKGGHEFPAAGDADLSEDVAQVLLRRVWRNFEPVGYPVVGMPPQDEFGDLLLARSQPPRSPPLTAPGAHGWSDR
jgi:hypothetical protein